MIIESINGLTILCDKCNDHVADLPKDTQIMPSSAICWKCNNKDKELKELYQRKQFVDLNRITPGLIPHSGVHPVIKKKERQTGTFIDPD